MNIPKFNFIFKHYEKIVLALALVFFVGSLVWLLNTFYTASSTQMPDEIAITANKDHYKTIDKKTFDSKSNFEVNQIWLVSEKRNKNPESPDYILPFTDFMVPFKIARSNAQGAKNKLIPYIYYKEGICPISKEKISLVKKAVVNTDALDTDKDGIPDTIEKKFNLDPKNPQDVYNDSDNDSFSNLDEYKYDIKGISNSKIHPPYVNRLELLKVSNTKIPFTLKRIIKHGDDKENWDIQVNVKLKKRGWTTKFLKIGDKIEINDMEYTVGNILDKQENILDPHLGVVIEKDLSSIVLYNSMHEKIIAEPNKPIYEPNRKITIKDLYTGKIILARVGNEITLGDHKNDKEVYKIVGISNNNDFIELKKNDKIFIVDKKSTYKPPIKSTIIINDPTSKKDIKAVKNELEK